MPRSGRFYIIDHDINGKRTSRGPFAVGARIGREPSPNRFDWTATRDAIELMKAMALGGVSNSAKLWVEQPGFHRVSAAELSAAGVNLNGVPVDQIALTFRDQAMPRRIHPASGTFSANSFIDFPVTPGYSLFTKEFPYVVSVDAASVIAIGVDQAKANTETEAWYWAESRYAPELRYNFGSPTDDPWYNQRFLAYPTAPVSFSASLPVTAVASTEYWPEIHADLIGVTDWPGDEQDHHVPMQIAGQTVAEAASMASPSKR